MDMTIVLNAWRATLGAIRDHAIDDAQTAQWRALGREGERAAWVRQIEAKNWAQATKAATSDLARYRTALMQSRGALAELTRLRYRLDTISPLLPAVSPDTSAAAIRVLRKELESRGLGVAKVKAALKLYKNISLRDTERKAQGALSAYVAILDRAAQLQARAAAGAIWLVIASRANAEPSVQATLDEDRMNALEASLVEAWTVLARCLRAQLDSVPLAAGALARTARVALTTLTPTLAHDPLAADAPSEAAPAALWAANLARSCMLAEAAALRVWWLWAAGDHDAIRADWREPPDAPARPRDTRKAVTLRRLATDPSSHDGRELVVAGTVTAIRIEHRGRKVISIATLTDGVGHEVACVLPYIKLDSSGLVPGCSARIAGTWALRSTEASGPALQVARRSRKADASRSLEDWAAWRLLPILQPVAHGLDMQWSWVRGVNGSANPLRYGTWYEE